MMVVLGGVTVMFLAGVPLRLFGGGAPALAVRGRSRSASSTIISASAC